MAIADRRKTRLRFFPAYRATGRLIGAGLLLCFVCFPSVLAQSKPRSKVIDLARLELDNGNYSKAIQLAETVVDEAGTNPSAIPALDTILVAQIAQEQYQDAAKTLEQYSSLVVSTSDPGIKARAFLLASDLYRSERKFPEALKQTRNAVETAPNDPEILAGYYLSLGRILFSSGYDLSAIIWLEKAEKLFERWPGSSGQLDTYRFLSLAWSSKMNYPAALRYSEKWIAAASGSRFKYKHRQSLFEAATLLGSTGQYRKALAAREKGLRLSLDNKNIYQARNFLSSLLLSSLYDADLPKASSYLQQLRTLDTDERFTFVTTLGAAIIAALRGESEASKRLFSELDKRENTSPFILPSWKAVIAEKNKEWEKVIEHNKTLLELTLAQNFREDLPGIYLSFASAHFRLGQRKQSSEYLDKTLALMEEIRRGENKKLSLGLLEVYHKAYRLLAQTKLESPQVAFELSDYLKAQVLKDRINTPAAAANYDVPEIRRKLEALSLEMNSDAVASQISELERSFTTFVPELTIPKPDFSGLDKVVNLDDKAIVSYLFTLDGRLVAFVWEKGKPVRSVYIAASESDIETEVKRTEQKIKNFIFFKRDGKELFDKLVTPLNVTAKHIIIVPDKHLWKIPFQALSPDGEEYLIEDKLVSYAPSVSILLEQLKNPKPTRRVLQAFANESYNDQFLRYVNTEATSVAAIFKSRPVLNATVSDFRRFADKADILHFSMHAQVDNDQPLNSFLGFRGFGKDSGRLTVEDLSNVRLRRGSLVFLASCDTNNVLSGEGLVSLAWGTMGAGATTVISAYWEANDKLTGVFANAFYRHYKQGLSSAEALQRASLEMIKTKSNNMHEPYYWADFTLSGDFR